MPARLAASITRVPGAASRTLPSSVNFTVSAIHHYLRAAHGATPLLLCQPFRLLCSPTGLFRRSRAAGRRRSRPLAARETAPLRRGTACHLSGLRIRGGIL